MKNAAKGRRRSAERLAVCFTTGDKAHSIPNGAKRAPITAGGGGGGGDNGVDNATTISSARTRAYERRLRRSSPGFLSSARSLLRFERKKNNGGGNRPRRNLPSSTHTYARANPSLPPSLPPSCDTIMLHRKYHNNRCSDAKPSLHKGMSERFSFLHAVFLLTDRR